jgi:multidrug efflux pump subunit AcrB
MTSLPSLSVRKPVLVNLLVVLTIIGGVVSYRQMPKDEMPDVAVDAVIVTTILPGASPKETEQILTIPLEEQIAKIDDIDEMNSTSMEGVSSIFVAFLPGVDIFEKITEIQNQIEKVERFPEEAERPSVTEIKVSFDTISIAVTGTAPEREVKDFVDDFEDELKNLPGVDEVRIAGLREREIFVEADPLRLRNYGLSLSDVGGALARRNLNLPGGLIRMDRGEFSVRTEAEYQNLDQIRETVLRGSADDGYVFLRDVATVTDTWADRTSIARLDGRPSVNITIKKTRESNAIDVVERIRALAAEYETRLPAGLALEITDDTSIQIRNRLGGLYNNMLVGLLLVIGSFTLFIGWRPALMVAVGIPVAFLATFIMLNAAGYSVNMLMLFGLIVVLGLVVDDAIVVCENIYRHVEQGMPLRQAAVFGAEQITWPVLATVMTTVAAFLPLLLMTGVLGRFMSIIPIVVTLALIASLFEAFFILPAHIVEWGDHGGSVGARHDREARPWLRRVEQIYRRVLAFVVKHRYASVGVVILVAGLTLNLAFVRMEFILFGGQDLEAFAVALETPAGASLKETNRIVREIEEHALDVASEAAEIESVRSEVGSLRRQGFQRQGGNNLAEVAIALVDLGERERTGHEVKDELRSRLQDVTGLRSINFEETRNGPPVGKAVSVRIKGDSFDTLAEIADELKLYLNSFEGVKDVVDSFPAGKDEVRPELDLEKLAALGLDVRTVAMEIRGAFEGIEATRIYDGNDEIEVRVRLDEEHRTSLAGLREMHFATPGGLIPFSNVGRMVRQPGYSQITHHNQKRMIQVTADVVEGVTNSRRVNEALMAEFADIPERYPGYTLDLGGEFEDTRESMASMIQAFGITVILIYVILGGLFQSFVQPLIVMFSVPFAFIGVVIGFFIMGMPMGMFSTIGIIALSGIVVNDSLILIDFINRERARGRGRERSILRAGVARLRPILLTSITTILGLMPMSLGLFGVDQFLQPMAMSIAWGLLFATGLTLLVIPCVYRIFDDISMLVLKRPLAANLAPAAAEAGPRSADMASEAA